MTRKSTCYGRLQQADDDEKVSAAPASKMASQLQVEGFIEKRVDWAVWLTLQAMSVADFYAHRQTAVTPEKSGLLLRENGWGIAR